MRCLAGLLLAIVSLTGIVGAYALSGDGTTTAAETSENSAAVVASPCAAATSFGKRLFANVRTVHFSGPAQPVNSDGTFGGLTAGDDAQCSITIYEKFIVREVVGQDGAGYRDVYVYDKLASFEQTIRP